MKKPVNRRLTATITISVPREFVRCIKAAAAADDRSVSGWVVHILKEALISSGFLPPS
jgi:hypothetical protein